MNANRLVISIDNVSAVKAFLLTLVRPRRTTVRASMLDRLAPGRWRINSLTSINCGVVSRLGGDHTASFVNRAVALYRHIANIPTHLEPPAMP